MVKIRICTPYVLKIIFICTLAAVVKLVCTTFVIQVIIIHSSSVDSYDKLEIDIY